jgi:hypothetical protein
MSIEKELTTEQIVQFNVESYNQRDIKKFISTFSEDIEFCNFPTNDKRLIGIEQVKNYYQEVFNTSPNLHSTIVKRIVFKNKIIDYENIIGRQGSNEIFEIVLIYEVIENKINKVTAIRN